MSVRAKMRLDAVVRNSWGGINALFSCQYDSSSEDDKSFQKATPSGSATFQIDNPAVYDQLVVGQNYYFDITPAM